MWCPGARTSVPPFTRSGYMDKAPRLAQYGDNPLPSSFVFTFIAARRSVVSSDGG